MLLTYLNICILATASTPYVVRCDSRAVTLGSLQQRFTWRQMPCLADP